MTAQRKVIAQSRTEIPTIELLRGACAMTRVTAANGSVSARANKHKATETASSGKRPSGY